MSTNLKPKGDKFVVKDATFTIEEATLTKSKKSVKLWGHLQFTDKKGTDQSWETSLFMEHKDPIAKMATKPGQTKSGKAVETIPGLKGIVITDAVITSKKRDAEIQGEMKTLTDRYLESGNLVGKTIDKTTGKPKQYPYVATPLSAKGSGSESDLDSSGNGPGSGR